MRFSWLESVKRPTDAIWIELTSVGGVDVYVRLYQVLDCRKYHESAFQQHKQSAVISTASRNDWSS